MGAPGDRASSLDARGMSGLSMRYRMPYGSVARRPAVVTNALHDPATAYSWAVNAAHSLESRSVHGTCRPGLARRCPGGRNGARLSYGELWGAPRHPRREAAGSFASERLSATQPGRPP